MYSYFLDNEGEKLKYNKITFRNVENYIESIITENENLKISLVKEDGSINVKDVAAINRIYYRCKVKFQKKVGKLGLKDFRNKKSVVDKVCG